MENNQIIPSKAQWVYDAANFDELADRYDKWAKEYDDDIQNIFGNVSPKKIVDVVSKYVSFDAKLLDVGAGTGLVGGFLRQRGYVNLDALDISKKMLEEASKKGIYHTLYQKILGADLELPTNFYDAIIAKGVFAPNHASSNAFDELVRITKPGGYIIFTIRVDYYEESNFKDKLSSLEVSKSWNLVEMTEKFACWPKATLDILYRIWVYQVC